MRADIAARLRRAMIGEAKNTPVTALRRNRAEKVTPQTPMVTPVTPVTCQKTWFGKDVRNGQSEADEAAIMERAGLCADSVPAIYLDAWARLNHQKPFRVSDEEWRQALDDGGRFLDRWGSEAALWGWTAGELFDVPRDGQAGGLIWSLAGERVEAFGPEYARTEGGRFFERGTGGGVE